MISTWRSLISTSKMRLKPLFAAFLMCLSASPVFAEEIDFRELDEGLEFRLVRDALSQEIGEMEALLGRSIPMFFDKKDLNGDRVTEIFVQLRDSRFTCKEKACETHIFAIADRGLTRLAQFHGYNVQISPRRGSDIYDITYNNNEDVFQRLRWDGSGYALN